MVFERIAWRLRCFPGRSWRVPWQWCATSPCGGHALEPQRMPWWYHHVTILVLIQYITIFRHIYIHNNKIIYIYNYIYMLSLYVAMYMYIYIYHHDDITIGMIYRYISLWCPCDTIYHYGHVLEGWTSIASPSWKPLVGSDKVAPSLNLLRQACQCRSDPKFGWKHQQKDIRRQWNI